MTLQTAPLLLRDQRVIFTEELFQASPSEMQRSKASPNECRTAPVCLHDTAGVGALSRNAHLTAREVRASLRNSLTVFSAAAQLMNRLAPHQPGMTEVSLVMLKQVQALSEQIKRLDWIAEQCEAAEI